jgi:hypothetical protein
MYQNKEREFSVLKGQTLIGVVDMDVDSDHVTFYTSEGLKYQLLHHQD